MGAAAKLTRDGPAVFWPRSVAATAAVPAGPQYRTPLAMIRAFRPDPLAYFTTAFQTFGDVVCFRSWPFKSFFLAHPDHIKHVLQEQNQRYVTHRHPAFWENPERFDPDRFMPERVRERPRFEYLPFSGGPRLCIGNEFALMEAQLVVAMTLQRYRMRLTAERPVVEPEVQLTLRPKGGLPMRAVGV